MSNKKRSVEETIRSSKRIRAKKEPLAEEFIPLDIWGLIMQMSSYELLSTYTLLGSRYKKCVYALPMPVLQRWVHSTVVEKSSRYRIRDTLTGEQYFYNVLRNCMVIRDSIPTGDNEPIHIFGSVCVLDLVYNQRIVVKNAYKIRQNLEEAKEDSKPSYGMSTARSPRKRTETYEEKLLAIAYFDLAHRGKASKDRRLLEAIVRAIAENYPAYLILFKALRDIASKIYSKDELLIGFYGIKLADMLLFDRSWYEDAYFSEFHNGTYAPGKFTLQNRTFVRVPLYKNVGYVWQETTHSSSIPPFPLDEALQINEKSRYTIPAILALSRLKPKLEHCQMQQVLLDRQ
jgi:hypothetical protein